MAAPIEYKLLRLADVPASAVSIRLADLRQYLIDHPNVPAAVFHHPDDIAAFRDRLALHLRVTRACGGDNPGVQEMLDDTEVRVGVAIRNFQVELQVAASH